MSLTAVQDIERAIAGLTPPQLAELYAWLDRYDPQPIDAREVRGATPSLPRFDSDLSSLSPGVA
jgi:hypothetical protein